MKAYLFLYIILKDIRLSESSEIVHKFIETSWITKKDFNFTLKTTFQNSICCNVYLHDTSPEIYYLFKKFVDYYPYEYSLNVNTYDCSAYFLLGSTEKEIYNDLKKIPTFKSNTEILVVLNNNLEINSNILNVTIYGNANANVVCKSGIWSLSENYLFPRIFQNVDKYEKLKQNDGKVNFHGRQLRIATLYRPPVSYLNRTSIKIIDDVEEEIFDADDDLERDGIEVKLFLLMAEKLNFTWIIRKSKYRYGKKYNETVWKDGLIEPMYKNKVDMAFGGIWLNLDHYSFVNLTEPWYQLFIHFLVPRPQPTTSFWALTRPFSLTIWILLVLSILLQSICMFIRARFNPQFPERFRHFLLTLIELTGRLLGSWAPKNMVNVKLQLYLWQMLGLILVTAYCSSLAAKLTNSEYEKRIDTIQQFLEANLKWGRRPPTPPFKEFFDLDDPDASQLPSRYKVVETSKEIHENIIKGNYAILGNFVGSVFFPEDEVANEDLKNYRVMKEMVGKFYATFAVQPWLLSPINRIMLRLKESGIATFHLQDVVRRRASFNLREILIEYDGKNGLRVLTLTPLGAGFFLLLLGLSISTLVFYLEIKYANKSKSIRENLRDIDRKRKLYSRSPLVKN
ncbi:uncharacterized protein LOC122524925 [Polistes fuscatus]|uniref:uncharacterized protein LOC122524925 n=1 Tax=Polistes fuscatus TaxID=30207 RepID=UPI001CA84F0D|nr:uncharacterized protein LOC122524925 [Polistes fuscatus]